MRCECGCECETGICECCAFIDTHPAVIRESLNNVCWDEEIEMDEKEEKELEIATLRIEIEAMEQAADRTLSRRHAEELGREICKMNRRLKELLG